MSVPESLLELAFTVLVIFALLLVLIARKRAGWVLLAFFRAGIQLITEPLREMMRSVGLMATYGEEGLRVDPDRPGLAASLLVYLRAVMLAGAIGWLAVGAMLGWHATQPTDQAVTALKTLDGRIADTQAKQVSLRGQIQDFDKNQGSRRSELVNQYKERRKQIIHDQEAALAAQERTISASPTQAQALVPMKAYLAQQRIGQEYEINAAAGAVENYLGSHLSSEDQAPLETYLEAWKTLAQARWELANADAQEADALLTRERTSLQDDFDSASSSLKEEEAARPDAEEAARWKFERGLLALLVAFGEMVGLLWGLGLTLELVERALGLSEDVRAIRARADRG